MKRRPFLGLMSSLPLSIMTPIRALFQADGVSTTAQTTQATEPLTSEQIEMLNTIKALEAQLRLQRGRFSWTLHNELRHLYGGFDEGKALAHADTILMHSIMDPYILNTLSDWYDEPKAKPRDPRQAVASLLRRAEQYPSLKHMRAACLIKAADIHAASNQPEVARRLYQRVLEGTRWKRTEALATYQSVARSQLAT